MCICANVTGCRRPVGLHLQAMSIVCCSPDRFAVSALPGLLEGARDAYACGAAGCELGVGPRGLEVVAGVGGEAALGPCGLDVVEPGVQGDQLLVADVVDVAAPVVRVGVAFHESGGPEDRQVLADERLACAEDVGERGRGAGLVGEFPDDLLAHRLSERGECSEHGHTRGWRGVVAAFVRVVSVMHLLVLVFPGSRVFKRVAHGRGSRRAVLLCLEGALCGLPLVGRQPGAHPQIVGVACPAGRPKSTFLSCQGQTSRPAGCVAGAPETDCPRRDWI